jgi:hypothetical protein
MGFVQSRAANNRHGIFAEERKSNPVVQAIGTGVVCLICQLPWGPDSVVQTFPDTATRNQTIAPYGMNRLGQGYLATIRKAWPDLRIVRVVGAGAAPATASLLATATAIVGVTLKYKGTAGNSVTVTTQTATDGVSTHFDLVISVSNGYGSTTETYPNNNLSGTGADVLPVLTNSVLIAAITKTAAGRPDNGTVTCSGGSDGTLSAASYIGTAQTGDTGIAACETDNGIRFVVTDDATTAFRPAVNAALVAHAVYMGDRFAILTGDSGLSPAGVATTVALNRSNRAIFVDGWYWMTDDTTGALQLVPPGPLAASVCANTSPSTSPSWKDPEIQALMASIVKLEKPRGAIAGVQTQNGIMTIIQETGGGYTFEAGVLTITPVSPAIERITRGRMGDYIAISATNSLRSYNDAPSVPVIRQRMIQAVTGFMDALKKAQNSDPEHQPHVLDWWWGDFSAANPSSDVQNGIYILPLNAQTSAGLEQVYLSMQFGENVVRLAA